MYAPTGFMWIVWTVLIIGILILIGLVVVLIVISSRARRRREMLGVWCRKCGHSLRGHSPGLVIPECPECGADLTQPYAIRRHGD